MITQFRYVTPLWLYRHPSALTMGYLRDPNSLRVSFTDPAYVVAKEYKVAFMLRGDWQVITVPKGLLTDFASVPRIFRAIVGRVGRHTEAAVVHDYLYGGEGGWWDRKDADDIFLAAMVAANVSPLVRNLAYQAVRLGGKKSWLTGVNAYMNSEEIKYGD